MAVGANIGLPSEAPSSIPLPLSPPCHSFARLRRLINSNRAYPISCKAANPSKTFPAPKNEATQDQQTCQSKQMNLPKADSSRVKFKAPSVPDRPNNTDQKPVCASLRRRSAICTGIGFGGCVRPCAAVVAGLGRGGKYLPMKLTKTPMAICTRSTGYLLAKHIRWSKPTQ